MLKVGSISLRLPKTFTELPISIFSSVLKIVFKPFRGVGDDKLMVFICLDDSTMVPVNIVASFISMLVLLLGFLEDWRYGLLAVVAFPFSFMFYGERLASVEKKATEKSLEEAWLDESLKLLGESSLANFYSIGKKRRS